MISSMIQPMISGMVSGVIAGGYSDHTLVLNLNLLGTGVPSGWAFIRATSATDVADDGTWLSYTSGQIRRTAARGYLSEQARTNRAWNNILALIGSGTITTGQVSIDGGTTGLLVTEDTSTAAFGIKTNTDTSGANGYELSVFVKPGTCDRVQLSLPTGMYTAAYANFYLNGSGSVSARGADVSSTYIKAYGNGWYRIGFSCANNATTSVSYELHVQSLITGSETLRPTILGTSRTFTVFGMQMCSQGGGIGVTTYIPTTTANVTRNGDQLITTGGTFAGLYNALGGTLYAEALLNSPSQNATVITISDGTSNNRICAYQNSFQSNTAGVTQYNSGSIFSGITYGAIRKFAVRFLLNNFNGAQNGTIGSDDTSGTVPVVDRLWIGANHQGAEQASAYIRTVRYYNVGKTNAELISMTK